MAAKKNDSTYSAFYQHLLNDRNNRAVDFSLGSNNIEFVSYEQTGIEVDTGVYATKAGLLLPVQTPQQITHANPSITNGGKAIQVWEPSNHPVLFQDGDLLNSSLNECGTYGTAKHIG